MGSTKKQNTSSQRTPEIKEIWSALDAGDVAEALLRSDRRLNNEHQFDRSAEALVARAIIFLRRNDFLEADHWFENANGPYCKGMTKELELRYRIELIGFLIRKRRFNEARLELGQLDESRESAWAYLKRSELITAEARGGWDTHEQRRNRLVQARRMLNQARRIWEDQGGDDELLFKQLVWQQFLIELHERGGTKSTETQEQIDLLSTLSPALGKQGRRRRLWHRLLG